MANERMLARLVWDGGDEVWIPPELGTPREDQMVGTPAERLVELAGRVCYDSLGYGRPSCTTRIALEPNEGEGESYREVEGYHDHIRKVGHGSVLEHVPYTVRFAGQLEPLTLANLVGRPGVWLEPSYSATRLTVNLRTLRDWDRFRVRGNPVYLHAVRDTLLHLISPLAPNIIPDPNVPRSRLLEARVVDPEYDEERWIAMFLVGSRGFSHELVRHGDFTGISQRSTRYVDESETDWIEHPLITQWREAMGKVPYGHDAAAYKADTAIDTQTAHDQTCKYEARQAYRYTVAKLETWLAGRGVDKTTARKQARGAARGYLGNALATEVIFSASVAQWRWMLNQRASAAADAEIRDIFCQVLTELKRSRYGHRFEDLDLRPSPDGIGQVAVEVRKVEPELAGAASS